MLEFKRVCLGIWHAETSRGKYAVGGSQHNGYTVFFAPGGNGSPSFLGYFPTREIAEERCRRHNSTSQGGIA